ncbi:MAG TPA: ATP synthase F1 subunit delta [Patescibacteria group bacterium]
MKKISPGQYALTLDLITAEADKKDIPRLIDGLIGLMTRNNDLGLADQVINQYQKLVKDQQGEIDIEVVSAKKIEPDQKKDLEQKLLTKNIKQININNVIDKNILGGLVVKYKDFILDASLVSQLNNLQQSLKQ